MRTTLGDADTLVRSNMRRLYLAARYLLGFLFTLFGLNGFFHFIPEAPPATQLATEYLHALSASHYMFVVFLFQLACGVCLLVNRFVPLALTVLAAIITNIFLYHLTLDSHGALPALVVGVLWIAVFLDYRLSFVDLLSPTPA